MDVGFFSPLKGRFNEALVAWQNDHRLQILREFDIPEIFRRPFEESAKESTAINSFRKTGIWVPQTNGPNRLVFGINEFAEEPEEVASPEVPNYDDR